MMLTPKEAVQVALNAVLDTTDAHSLKASSLKDFEALFASISRSIEAGDHARAASLASIGAYLAEEWSIYSEEKNAEALSHLDPLREALKALRGCSE